MGWIDDEGYPGASDPYQNSKSYPKDKTDDQGSHRTPNLCKF